MDYKIEMKKGKKKITKTRKKLDKLRCEYQGNRKKLIKRTIKNFISNWRENLNFYKILKMYIITTKRERKFQNQIHEYVKLCGKPKR